MAFCVFMLYRTHFANVLRPLVLTRNEKRKKEHEGSLVRWIVACYCILGVFLFLTTGYMFKNRTDCTKKLPKKLTIFPQYSKCLKHMFPS